jgi:hypothetical protein
MAEEPENLLYDSISLTREEEALRNELVEWCKAKLRKGNRPVPLHTALTIVSGWMADPDKFGLR